VIFFKKYSGPLRYALFISIFNTALTGYYLNIILSSRSRSWKDKWRLSRSYISGVFDGMSMGTATGPEGVR
jgi:hypothetical protein